MQKMLVTAILIVERLSHLNRTIIFLPTPTAAPAAARTSAKAAPAPAEATSAPAAAAEHAAENHPQDKTV
jgi:hypothetical protein